MMILLFSNLHLCIYSCFCTHSSMYVSMCEYIHATVHMWISEYNFYELTFSFFHLGPQGSASGHQAWQQALLAMEPSCQPYITLHLTNL